MTRLTACCAIYLHGACSPGKLRYCKVWRGVRKWSDKFKLGKSAFIKRDLRLLPLTEAEFEADFFLDRESSGKRREHWLGTVIEREFGAVLAAHARASIRSAA